MATIDERLRSLDIALPDVMPAVVDGYGPAFGETQWASVRSATCAIARIGHLSSGSSGSILPTVEGRGQNVLKTA
jgi:hypothetical protein